MRKFGLTATLLVIGVIVVIMWTYGRASHGVATPTLTPAATATTKDGAIACLPNKNSNGPHTLECALGLQGDDGGYYALKNLPDPTLPNGTRMHIEGTLSAPAADERYDIRGVINVQKATKI